jgi:hypothetical protein
MKNSKVITVGGDFKITPKGRVGFLELNGRSSGIQGFHRLYGEKDFDLSRTQIWKKYQREWLDQLEKKIKLGGMIDAQNVIVLRRRPAESLDDRMCNDQNNKQKQYIIDHFKQVLYSMMERDDIFAVDISRRCEEMMCNDIQNLSQDFQVDLIMHVIFGVKRFINDPKLGLIIERDVKRGYDTFINCYWEVFLRNLYHEIDAEKKEVLVSKFEQGYYLAPNYKLVYVEDELRVGQNPEYLEKIAKDKQLQKVFVPKENLSPYCLWRGSEKEIDVFLDSLFVDTDGLIDLQNYPYVVVKGITGCGGDEVKIFNIHDRTKITRFLKICPINKYLLEGFIPSKDFQTGLEGKMHDGSMRYLLDILVTIERSRTLIEPIFEKAYWRISPYAKDDKNTVLDQKYVVNLKRDASVAECNERDFGLVKAVIRKITNDILGVVLNLK